MRVLLVPDFSARNPYQRLLADALRRRGVESRAASSHRRRALPLLHAVRSGPRPKVLHLHWTHPYIDRLDRSATVSRARVGRFLAELRLLRAFGMRFVWTVHNVTRHERSDPGRELLVGREIVRLADAVIVHCAAAREAVMSAYGSPHLAERIHVIPHGSYIGAYPDDVSREEARAMLGLDEQDLVFAFVGQIRDYKGVPTLMDAFRRVADPRARLLVAGEARDHAARKELQRSAALDPRIRLDLGFVAPEALQRYFNAADVVVTPFVEILTSGTAILAASFGKAVIAPRRGCLPQTLDERGTLFYDPLVPSALEEALGRAIEADLGSMGAHNRTIASRLDWDVIAERTAQVYEGRGRPSQPSG